MINFKLNNINDIAPWGAKENQVISWFALTDGEYWIDLKKTTLFEYGDEILNYWGVNNKHVSYQIIRFIEDFSSLFFKITESIPNDLIDYVKSAKLLSKIEAQGQIWMGVSNDKELALEESFRWIMDRTLYSYHLTGGPKISFFRTDEKIIIVWISNQLVDRIPIWTADTGEVEIAFEDFVLQIAVFWKNFLVAMKEQVNNALEKDWGPIIVDKIRLKEEQIERENDFDYWIKILRQGASHQSALPETNWKRVKGLMDDLINNSPNNG